MKAVITSAKKEIIQQTGEVFLDVEFEIREGEEVVDVKHYGFNLDATEETVLDEIGRYVANYEAEKISRENGAEKLADEIQSDALLTTLVGTEIEASV